MKERNSPAILSLVAKEFKYTKSETAPFKCHTNPTQADSPTYEVIIKIIDGSESLCEILLWMCNFTTLIEGLQLDDALKIQRVICKICIGQASTIFKADLPTQQEQQHLVNTQAAYCITIAMAEMPLLNSRYADEHDFVL